MSTWNLRWEHSKKFTFLFHILFSSFLSGIDGGSLAAQGLTNYLVKSHQLANIKCCIVAPSF